MKNWRLLGIRGLDVNCGVKWIRLCGLCVPRSTRGTFEYSGGKSGRIITLIIFDYSRGEGPVCVVPVDVLFKLPFVAEKRKQEAYANNGYWCSQRFPRYHELTKFVLSYTDRWDVL